MGAHTNYRWLEVKRSLALESSGTKGFREFEGQGSRRVSAGVCLSICKAGADLHYYVSSRALWRARDRATSFSASASCRVLMISQQCQCRAGSSVQAGGTPGARQASCISSRGPPPIPHGSPFSSLASGVLRSPHYRDSSALGWLDLTGLGLFRRGRDVQYSRCRWSRVLGAKPALPFPFPTDGTYFRGGQMYLLPNCWLAGGCGVSSSNTAGEPQGRPVCTCTRNVSSRLGAGAKVGFGRWCRSVALASAVLEANYER